MIRFWLRENARLPAAYITAAQRNILSHWDGAGQEAYSMVSLMQAI